MAKAAKTTEEDTKPIELITVSKRAMSADVGPIVVRRIADWQAQDEESKSLAREATNKRYDVMKDLTLAIVKAANGDDDIDLSVYFGGDSKLIGDANDRIGIALGIRVAKIVGEGDKQKQKIEYSPEVREFFPSKDDTGDAKTRKRTMQSNFTHMLKKCAQGACAVIEKDIKIKADKSGTLMVSGPIIKKEFGQDSVLLNEKVKMEGKKGETITLKTKPSFTALADIGARAMGAVLKKPESNHRGRAQAVDQVKHLTALAKEIVKMVEKIDVPNEAQVKAMESMWNALDVKLGNVDRKAA